jgi:hypothetical protein
LPENFAVSIPPKRTDPVLASVEIVSKIVQKESAIGIWLFPSQCLWSLNLSEGLSGDLFNDFRRSKYNLAKPVL